MLFTKAYAGLVPSDEDSNAAYTALKFGETVNVEIKKVRNLAFHRKFFALLNLVCEHFDPPKTYSR